MLQVLVVAPPEYAPRIHDALEPTRENVQYRFVPTVEQGLITLGEQSWNAVLLTVLDEQSLAALPIDEYVDLAHKAPVIVLAGKIGEDAAAELVRCGVYDVVSIHRLERLPLVLERELDQQSSILVHRQNSRRAHARFATIINHLPIGIGYHDERGQLVSCNDTALRLMGLSENEVRGLEPLPPGWHVIDENGVLFPHSEHPTSVAARTKKPVQNVLMGIFRPRTNDRIWIRASAIPVLDRAQRVAYVMNHFSDVTDLRQMVDTIRTTEKRFRLAFEHSGMGMVIYSPRANIMQANATACRIFGRSLEQVIGLRMEDVTHPDDVVMSLGKAAVARHPPHESVAMEKRYVQPSGAIVHCLVTVDALPGLDTETGNIYVVSIQDITARKEVEAELKRLNAQLLQAKKMEALGILAGGMAHDFNNILAAITCSTDILLNDLQNLPDTGDLPEIAFDLQTSAQRASDLIRQIVMFGRQANQERVPVKLDQALENAMVLIRKLCPANVSLRVIARSSPVVSANTEQVQQLITSLCTRALRLIEKRNGTVSVELDTVSFDAASAKAIPGLHEGRYARICVTDAGPSMNAVDLEQLFEPLSTTDSAGKDSGLAMAIVQGIVIAHEGAIRARSVPGQGTAIDVWLPLVSEAPRESAPQKSSPLGGNNEHLLIVDDEEALARIVGRLLQNLGYRVTVQTKSSEALELFEKDPSAFHAVLVDLHMPRPSGIEVARTIHAQRPELPIFIMSGYSDALGNTPPEELGIVGVLQKPVSRDTLAAELRRIFDQPR